VRRPEPERLFWLESSCGTDRSLMAAVLKMLEADGKASSLLDRGLPDVAYEMVGTSFDPVFSREFDQYRLKEILGEGGMGVVWLAERLDAGNPVAIKFLPHSGLSPARRERFAEEIRTLAKLKHPFIARLYDAGALLDGTPWFAMEYVEGVDLSEYCRKETPSIQERLRLFRSICEAVQYAHGQEIIHRDLKPSNIMVEKNGTPKLLDFGIARKLLHLEEQSGEKTNAVLRFMSRDYAAPEWARDGTVGPFTDVYSLGVILYGLLTGCLPFETAEGSPGGRQSRPESNPEKPSLVVQRLAAKKRERRAWEWHELDDLCLKAMHWDAGERYKSVEALVRDIDHYLNGEPLEARPDTLRYRARKFVGRHRVPVVAASLALALIAGISVLFTARLAKARNAALAEAARKEHIQRFMLNLFRGDDKESGPASELRVVTLIDRGVNEAQSLNREPEVQAELYQTLGTMYQKLGKLDRADELLQLALEERQSLSEQNYSALAENLIAIGMLRSDQGKSDEAQRIVRKALTLIDTHESRNKSLLAKANFALGRVLVESGKNAEAASILDKVVSWQTAEDPHSPDLAKSLRALADAQLYLGHYSISDSLNQRSLAIDRQVYGDGHPQVSDDLHSLAAIQDLWGHYSEAERYHREALRIAETWYGKDHPDTARKMTALAGTLIYEGKYRQAGELLQPALATQERVYGDMHPNVAYVLNVLGSVANAEGDFNSAEAYRRRVIQIYLSAYGDRDYRVAVGLENLGTVYLKSKQYEKAEPILKDAVQRFIRTLSADNINTAETEIKLGRTLLFERRYREAEKQTRTGYEVLVKQTSSTTSFVEGARHDLALVYRALKQPEEARKFEGKLVAATPGSESVVARH
jgi:eukaryotic-like serine/threonine-protein kinase